MVGLSPGCCLIEGGYITVKSPFFQVRADLAPFTVRVKKVHHLLHLHKCNYVNKVITNVTGANVTIQIPVAYCRVGTEQKIDSA